MPKVALSVLLVVGCQSFTLPLATVTSSRSIIQSIRFGLTPPIHRADPFERQNDFQYTSLYTSSVSDSSTETFSDSDKSVLKQFDKEIEKEARRRQKAKDQLSKLEERLQNLEQKKKNYLDGMQLGIPEEKNFSETTLRSAVKAFTWRIIGGLVTLLTSLRFSSSLSKALSIVASDFFSKSITMFVGERLMNKSQAGRKGGADKASRSLAKALIWRLFAICNTLTMAVFVLKDLKAATRIAGFDSVFKTALMFIFERVWAKIEWGKEYYIEFSI